MKKIRRTHGQVINQTTGKTSMQFTTLNSEVLRNKRSKKMSNNDRPWHWPHPTQLPTPLYTHKTLQVDCQGNAEKTVWQAWTRDCNQLGYPIYQKAQRLLIQEHKQDKAMDKGEEPVTTLTVFLINPSRKHSNWKSPFYTAPLWPEWTSPHDCTS